MAAPRKDNVKKLILDTAEQLLETRKLSEISLAEIASEAGISKGTLYYHYKNKNELLLDITDKYLNRQWQDLIDWTEDASKDTSLNRFIQYVLARDVATVNIRLHLFYDAVLGNEEIRSQLLARYQDFAALLSEKIARRTDRIAPAYLAWLLLLLSDGLFIHKMLGNDHLNIEEFIRQTGELGRQN